jgi:hypothetical protein
MSSPVEGLAELLAAEAFCVLLRLVSVVGCGL